jgi:hypothetical protein
MQVVQKLTGFTKDLVRWLLMPRQIWFNITIVTLALGFLIAFPYPKSPADRVRYCGLVFQLFGIVCVVINLRSRIRLFGRPDLIDYLRRWWSHRPRWNRKKAHILHAEPGSFKRSFGDVQFWHGVAANASIEARFAALEKNVQQLKKRQESIENKIQEEFKRVTEIVDSERRVRDSQITDLRKMIEELGVGELHVEIIGVIYLVLGIVMAGLPGEIAYLLPVQSY